MMYIFLFLLFSFGALYFCRTFCIYMGRTDIEYCIMTFVIYGQHLWFVFLGLYLWICVYGYVYRAMCMDSYGCVSGYGFMDLYGCVSGYMYGFV